MDEMLQKYEDCMQTLLTEKEARIAVLEAERAVVREVLSEILILFVAGSGDDSEEYNRACGWAEIVGVIPRIPAR